MTEQQKAAAADQKIQLQKALDYIKSGEQFITITGGAGVGKTYLTRLLIVELIKLKGNHIKIVAGAVAHQAVNIIKEVLEGVSENLEAKTFASGFNMRMRTTNMGKEFVVQQKYEEDAEGNMQKIIADFCLADVLVLDECSMYSGKQCKIVEKYKKDDAIVIYLGDMAQLPSPSIEIDRLYSPTFDYPLIKLNIQFRCQGDNIVLTNEYRNYILNILETGKLEKANPNIILKRAAQKSDDFIFIKSNHFYKNHKGEDIFFNTAANSIAMNLDDIYHSKYIGYHKQNCKEMGMALRKKIFPNKKYDYMIGDLMVCTRSFVRDKRVVIETSQYVTISGGRIMTARIILLKDSMGKYKFFDIRNMYKDPESEKSELNFLLENYTANSNPNDIKTIDIKYISLDFNNNSIKFIPFKPSPKDKNKIISLKEMIKKGDYYHRNEFKNTYDALSVVEDFFCDMEYGYGINVHKSQGSTYKNTFVNLKDIFSVKIPETQLHKLPADKRKWYQQRLELQKMQATYVAISRASNKQMLLY